MKLYGYFRSSASYRCRIALNIKGIKVEHISVHLRKGQQRTDGFLNLNPQGLVPALEANGHTITQSMAIIEWLDENYPIPALLPKDTFERAEVRAFCLAIASDLHPLNNLRVLKHIKDCYNLDQEGVNTWYRHWIQEGLTGCEAMLARMSRQGDFCFGDKPSMADVFLIPQLYNARRYDCDLSDFPRLTAVESWCLDLPAFDSARPENQPDFEE